MSYEVIFLILTTLISTLDLFVQTIPFAAQAGIASISLTCLISIIRLYKNSALFIIQPEFWFYFLILIYFGIGSSAIYFLNGFFLVLYESIFTVSSKDITTINILIQTTLLFHKTLNLVTYKIFNPKSYIIKSITPNQFKSNWLFIYFLLYIIVSFSNDILGSGVSQISHYIGYAIIFYSTRQIISSRRSKFASICLGFIFAIEIYLALLDASKLYIILPFIIALSAYLAEKGFKAKAIIGVFGIFFIFSLLVPFTQSLRTNGEITRDQGEEITYSVISYGFNYMLFRLSHTNAATHVLSDESDRYNTLSDWTEVIIPRILYENKSNLSFRGNELSEDLFGFDSTSTARTVFVDAYASAGFAGLIFVNCLYFMIIILGRRLVHIHSTSNSFLVLPPLFMLIFIMMSLEGLTSTSLVGPLIQVIPIILFTFLAKCLKKDERKSLTDL